MKTSRQLVLLLVICLSPCASFAEGVWLLRGYNHRYSVDEAIDGELRNIAKLGGGAIFGESESAVAVLSFDSENKAYALSRIDKTTRQVSVSRHVNSHVLTQLAGPSKDVVLTDAFAYFITVRYTEDKSDIQRNRLGGQFDLNRLSAMDGSLRTFPLPRECTNPRLIDFEGVPLIYSWNGFAVWKLDPAKEALEPLVTRADLVDVLAGEESASRTGDLALGAFADYVAIPGSGLFRLSRLGRLQPILDARLMLIERRQRLLSAPIGGTILRVFSAMHRERPVIGVVRKNEGRIVVSYVDPETMGEELAVVLPNGTVTESIVPSIGEGVLYIDRDTQSLNRTSREGTEMLWKRSDKEPWSTLSTARILLVE